VLTTWKKKPFGCKNGRTTLTRAGGRKSRKRYKSILNEGGSNKQHLMNGGRREKNACGTGSSNPEKEIINKEKRGAQRGGSGIKGTSLRS